MATIDQLAGVESGLNGDLPAPGVVLDTNVVMDWLVFGNPDSAPWVAAVQLGSVRWLASEAMRDELAHVLGRGVGAAKRPDMDGLWAAWSTHCTVTQPADLTGAAIRLRCTDPDDQKFIDLALGCGARWLVSRDRAVLKLAKRARALGLVVLTPEQWIGELSPPT